MDKFEGDGADCYRLYYAHKHRGTIQQVGRENEIILIPMWLSKPCTYTPQEPQWVECSPGEALDVWLAGKRLQIRNINAQEWVDTEKIFVSLWRWGDRGYQYRKEA